MSIKEISTELYDRSSERPLTRNVVEDSLVEKILKQDRIQFLTYNFREFQSGYCQSLMLTFHELWQDFAVPDWMKLFSSFGKRPNPRAFDDSGAWADCMFFSSWIRLNPFPLLIQVQNAADDSAFRVAEHFRLNAPMLFPDEEDWDELNGRVFCHTNVLQNVRTNLLTQDSSLKIPYTTPEELRSYLVTLKGTGVLVPIAQV